MAEASALTIAALPADGHAWRIDWFGEIAFPNRMIRRKQPSVLLHLSRVLDERYREDHSVLLNPESTFVAKQRKVWVSVGTLPLLRIGAIWRDGLLETTPDYEFEDFPDLDIGSETVSLIKAGLNLEENGFLLPRGEHPWHMQATQSYCLMVDLPGERRLIIPCIELIFTIVQYFIEPIHWCHTGDRKYVDCGYLLCPERPDSFSAVPLCRLMM